MKKQKVYLDLDGTVYDLYSIDGWLDHLRKENAKVFNMLGAVVTERELLKQYPLDKFDITVLTMLPKGASKKFAREVTKVKSEWLDEHFPSITNRIFMKYGNDKNIGQAVNSILIDDNEAIRRAWNGVPVKPKWGAIPSAVEQHDYPIMVERNGSVEPMTAKQLYLVLQSKARETLKVILQHNKWVEFVALMENHWVYSLTEIENDLMYNQPYTYSDLDMTV